MLVTASSAATDMSSGVVAARARRVVVATAREERRRIIMFVGGGGGVAVWKDGLLLLLLLRVATRVSLPVVVVSCVGCVWCVRVGRAVWVGRTDMVCVSRGQEKQKQQANNLKRLAVFHTADDKSCAKSSKAQVAGPEAHSGSRHNKTTQNQA